jgi:ribosome assembly protein 1
MQSSSSSNIVQFTIRASPLPRPILDYILQNLAVLKKLQTERKAKDTQETPDKGEEDQVTLDVQGEIFRTPNVLPEKFWSTLEEICREQGGEWADITDRIWAFGPQAAGGCLLVDARKATAPFS